MTERGSLKTQESRSAGVCSEKAGQVLLEAVGALLRNEHYFPA
jgi:hypothetical protein